MNKKASFQPGELLRMSKSDNPMLKKKAAKVAGIKHSGSFHGKSNKLGYGGRAAQLKARGVPGGVIGELARRAHAAPGQENYHGKKQKASKKEFTMAMKKKASSKKVACKTSKKVSKKHSSEALKGMKKFMSEEAKEKKSSKKKSK